jgi:hypothetical protein
MKYSMLMYAVVLGCAVHVNAAAQGSTYRRQAGDTLLYRELAEEKVRIQGDPQEYHIVRDAVLAVAFTGGDTAQAWYEALRLRDDVLPIGHQTAGSEAVGLGFEIVIDERGWVSILGSHVFPDSVLEVWDPLDQFNEFFPVLPGRALEPGLEWGDTILDRPLSRSLKGVESYFAVHRVIGDSMIGDMPVVIVESEAESRATGRGTRDDGTPVESTSRSFERGRFYFSAQPGILIRRRMTGEITTTLTYHEAAGTWQEQIRTEFTTTIELLSGPPR